jgi:hypothetical protein
MDGADDVCTNPDIEREGSRAPRVVKSEEKMHIHEGKIVLAQPAKNRQRRSGHPNTSTMDSVCRRCCWRLRSQNFDLGFTNPNIAEEHERSEIQKKEQ